MKLSPYTIAKNCSDLTDVIDGINEIDDKFKYLNSQNKKIPRYYYKRYYNLLLKHNEYLNK